MAEVAVTVTFLLVERFLSFLLEEGDSKERDSTEVKSIRDLLSTLRAYLKVHNGGGSQNEMQANKATQIRDIVHEIEDELDKFMFRSPCKFHKHKLTIFAHGLVQPMKLRAPLRELSTELSKIKERFEALQGRHKVANRSDSTESSHHTNWRDDTFVHSHEEDEIVGFENRTVTLLDQLLREEQNRRMEISVVGPGGYGKSTFVRIAYADKWVKRHFDCSAWVPVTENFDETALVDNMIMQFEEKMKGSISFGRGDRQSQVRSYLQNKRYLVVLDDVCNKKDLQRIFERYLPKSYGSRIIVTTHKHDVVVSHDGSPHRVHDLSSGLSEEAAWDLFCKKAFFANGDTCPLDLVGIARKIVSMCGGSPYAIVSVSRMLAKKGQLPAEWQSFYDTLGSEIGIDPDSIVSKTLLRSFNDLSGPLKSCFLYLSVFPENYRIERGRLIRLWLAEGFVELTKGMEKTADNYLDELIARNLILVIERDFSGKAMIICGVNNLVHKFLINKSNEHKFVTILSKEDAGISGSKPRRVSIRSDGVDLSDLGSVGLSCVRSSFVFTQKETHQPKIGKFIGQFMLLKVLDLQGASLQNFPEEICHLTLLRYLSLRGTRIKTIPSSISKLVYIETLDLKQTQVRALPKQILRLPNLRYLLAYLYDVENYVTFDRVEGVALYPGVRFLSKLLKLTLVKADDPKFIAELGHLTELRKLGLIDLKTEDGAKLCAVIQKMKQLSTLDVRSVNESTVLDLHDMPNPPCYLQRLYLKGPLLEIPKWISSLKSLVRVGLLWSKLSNSPIPALQVLPNLIELQLVDAFIGEEFIFEAGNFSKLKILQIKECSKLTTIIIQEGAMPTLGKLTLGKCKSLHSLPLGIGNLAQLNELNALDMNDEFTNALQPTSKDYWMVEHIPVIWSLRAGRSGKWIYNGLS